jgi:hypothetical protein
MSHHDYFKKGLHIIFPKKTFSYKWIVEQCFLQYVIINVYSCPSTWNVFLYIIFKWKWIFENLMILCKFNVMFIKVKNQIITKNLFFTILCFPLW